MVLNDFSQTFLFTFRCNGDAHGEPLVETLVEQLAGYDPSAADDAYRSAWYGKERDFFPMPEKLGFAAIDVQGVRGALYSQSHVVHGLPCMAEEQMAAIVHASSLEYDIVAAVFERAVRNRCKG